MPPAVTPLRPRLREDARPLPQRWSLLCPWAVLRRVLHLLPGPGGSLLCSWGTVLLRAVVRRSCHGRSDRLLLVSPPRAQSSLSTSLSSSRGLPAGPSSQKVTQHQKKEATQGATWLWWWWLVVVVRTRCYNGVFLHTTARWHLIGVAEHLGIRLPASPPPWAQRPEGRRPKNAANLQQTTPHRRQVRHAQLKLCVPVSMATEMSTDCRR